MNRSIASRRWCLAGTCLACAVVGSAPFGAASAAWDTVSNIRMGIEANDNPRLGQQQTTQSQTLQDLQDHTSVRALVDMIFRLQNIGQRSNIYVQPRIRADAYSDTIDKDLQRKDLYLFASGNYKWERAEIGLRSNFARESILSSELLDAGLIDLGDPSIVGQPIQTDTGQLVMLSEHRNRAIVAPYANFTISPRSSIGVDATYLNQTYSGLQLRTRSDIWQKELGTHVSRTIDSRTSATARLFAADYHAVATDNDTRTVGVEGGLSRKLNETLSLNLSAGLERSAFTYLPAAGPTVHNAAANYIFDVGLGKQTETTTLKLDVSRQIDPSAAGFMTRRNELRILYAHDMSQRLTLNFALRAFQSGGLSSTASTDETQRNYARLAFELDWAFTRTWSFAVGYDAVSQSFQHVSRENGSANVVSLGVVYQGLSRQGR